MCHNSTLLLYTCVIQQSCMCVITLACKDLANVFRTLAHMLHSMV